MSDVTTIVDTYLDMWNENDAAKRAELITTAWATDAHYVDPMLEADGHDALSAMVEGVHAQFPGHTFRRLSGVDAHHDRVRFAWDLVAPDGTVTVAGIDVGVIDAAGKLQSITGFFGDPPADAA
jgi:hypothetical protein